MIVIHTAAVQDAVWTAIAAVVDAQSSPGTMRVYAGTRPANGGALAGNTMMAEFTLRKPCSASITGGVWTLQGVDHAQVVAAGSPSFVRFSDGADNFAVDVDAGVVGVPLADSSFAAMLFPKAAFSAGEYLLVPDLVLRWPA